MLDKKNFYINGEWVSPKKSNDFKVIDPSTEEECAVISLAGVDDVNDAVSAAALTASFTSSTPAKDITAHSSSVEGSITLKSFDFFGETHSPFI